jgi:hypothetical protein
MMSQEYQNRVIKSIETALEFSKQQIGFAAILVGLSITLNKEIVPKEAIIYKLFLIGSWVVFIVSISFRLFLIGHAAYELSHEDEDLKDVIKGLNGLGYIQFLCLLTGLALC